MKRLAILFLGSGLLAIVGGACGGVEGTLFFGPNAGGAGGASTTAAQGPGDTTTTGTPGSSTAATSTAATSSGVTSTSSATSSSATSTTSSSTAATTTTTSTTSSSTTASSTSSSSSSSTGAPQVACNGMPCQPGDVCCFNPTGPGDHCDHPNTCDGDFIEISCNGPEDCPNNGICCARYQGGPPPAALQFTRIGCASTCSGGRDIVVCSEARPDVCPGTTQCRGQGTFGLGVGYRLCF